MLFVHGLFDLGLLRLHLLVLIILVVVLFLIEVWFLVGRALLFVLFGLVVTRFGKLVVMLLMPMMLRMFFLYRDSSVAPLHDMRRRFKAVVDVLDAMIRYGISLSVG